MIVPRVPCLKAPAHSYALYLPSAYRGDRPWPVLFAFAPNARGVDPVRLFEKPAERLGFIVVGSNDSKNGPLRPALQAQEALWNEVRARFNVDPKRCYATGFSGGSRMAVRMALEHSRSFAGVISIGAFFADKRGLLGSGPMAFALLCGQEDFNHWELLAAREELGRRGNPVWTDRFPGPHAWPQAEHCDQALTFFQLVADRRAGVAPHPRWRTPSWRGRPTPRAWRRGTVKSCWPSGGGRNWRFSSRSAQKARRPTRARLDWSRTQASKENVSWSPDIGVCTTKRRD